MDRLRILHQTSYRYSEPVAFGRHRLVIRPREGHDIQVEHLRLEIVPDHTIHWNLDVFGNSIAVVDFREKADFLAIRNEVILRRSEEQRRKDFQDFDPVPLPPVYGEIEMPVIQGYLQPVYLQERGPLQAWLAGLPFWNSCAGAAEFVGALNGWIYKQIAYRRREEKGVQTPLQTLGLASGSCRDMATLMLEALRAAGLAARFASGYLDSEASAAGRAATHAWIEVYFSETGWCGCDPTINESTSSKHILTGVSSHPRGVMPVSGVYAGPANLCLGMEVSVKMEKWAA